MVESYYLVIDGFGKEMTRRTRRIESCQRLRLVFAFIEI